MKTFSILVVDDDHAHRMMLQTLAEGWGYQVSLSDDGDDAIKKVHNNPFDLILMDIRMVHLSGIEALKEIKSINPSIPIIMMTAYSSVETAVQALKEGAYDYLIKPLDFEKLKRTMARAVEHLRLKAENRMLKVQLGEKFNRLKIIGNSPAMVRLLETVERVADSEASVIVDGESGTGKELIAGAIHHNSPRKKGPFIKINCAALTETLLESELFGHERGAFTGAERRKEGCFVQATGGSLFLDEVSEMPLKMQVKLLRVLQEREVVRVGGEKVVPIDVRVIVATNRDLELLVKERHFRQDLFYRLNVVHLKIPPLKERAVDIPLLAQHFISHFAKKNRKTIKGFTPKGMDLLVRYPWPGNVRELMNAVERAVVLSRKDYLDENDFNAFALGEKSKEPTISHLTMDDGDLTLASVEKEMILSVLEKTGGNKSEAARRLGITRKTLHKKLQKYERNDQ